jgi:hypothetical protein
MVDQTFLSPPPRTLAWWQERKQCAGCQHVEVEGTAMRCKVTTPVVDAVQRLPERFRPALLSRMRPAFCIDAREPGQACGPAGALFKEAP